MQANVGTLDRVLRALIGIALLAVAALGHGPIRYVGIAGIVLVLTALVRFCPACWLLRLRTTRISAARRVACDANTKRRNAGELPISASNTDAGRAITSAGISVTAKAA